jgi:hypothetical protein
MRNLLDWHWRLAILPRRIGGRWIVGWYQQRNGYYRPFHCERRLVP